MQHKNLIGRVIKSNCLEIAIRQALPTNSDNAGTFYTHREVEIQYTEIPDFFYLQVYN